jgi:hypothetical protein
MLVGTLEYSRRQQCRRRRREEWAGKVASMGRRMRRWRERQSSILWWQAGIILSRR